MKFFGSQSSNDDEVEVWPEMDEQAVHTAEHPFCFDMTCYCHRDADAIQQTAQDVQAGLLSTQDADRFYHGKTV
jgi:hypothetical protein